MWQVQGHVCLNLPGKWVFIQHTPVGKAKTYLDIHWLIYCRLKLGSLQNQKQINMVMKASCNIESISSDWHIYSTMCFRSVFGLMDRLAGLCPTNLYNTIYTNRKRASVVIYVNYECKDHWLKPWLHKQDVSWRTHGGPPAWGASPSQLL